MKPNHSVSFHDNLRHFKQFQWDGKLVCLKKLPKLSVRTEIRDFRFEKFRRKGKKCQSKKFLTQCLIVVEVKISILKLAQTDHGGKKLAAIVSGKKINFCWKKKKLFCRILLLRVFFSFLERLHNEGPLFNFASKIIHEKVFAGRKTKIVRWSDFMQWVEMMV